MPNKVRRGSGDGGGVWETPRIAVEHRHEDEMAGELGHFKVDDDREGREVHPPVVSHHSLRVSRGATGVVERHGVKVIVRML